MVTLRNGLRFSTGTVLPVRGGVLGIAPDGAETIDDVPDVSEHDEPLTTAERVELADHMIAAWTKYKQAAKRGASK